MSSTNPAGWRKSSYSGPETNCIEVGRVDQGAAVRDTKSRAQGYVMAGVSQWQAFIAAVKSDRFT